MEKKKISDVATLTRGVSYKKEQASKYKKESYEILIRANNINAGHFVFDDLIYIPSNLVNADQWLNFGDIVITMSSGSKVHVGKVAIVKNNLNCTYGAFCSKITPKEIDPQYLFYSLQNGEFRQHIETQSKGTNINNIKQSYILDYELYVPSISEQQRIVSRIEELFSSLDNAVETLQKTKEQLAVYRQAVLKEAFEGRYTNEWRYIHKDISPKYDYETIAIENPIYKDSSGDENEIHLQLPESWIKLRIGDVFKVEVGSTPSRQIPEYWNGDVNWVSSGEVHFNRIYATDEQITEEGLAHASTNVHPVGTVMLAMIGEGKTRGQAAILEIPAAHNQNTAAILVSSTPCSPKYIYYFLQMNYENTRRVGSGNNQKALNKERVRALRFPFTSFAEQNKIVEEIESRLSMCDSIEQTVNTALTQAEAMRQSILKEAFEGRL